MNSNPYESPKTVAPVPLVVYTTRWRAARAGMWRGAKIGFFTFVIVMIGAMTVAGVVALVGHVCAGWRLPRDLELATPLDLVKGVGQLVVGLILFGILYGALPGGVILGSVAVFSWRRPEIISEPQTSNS
jgi:hypothetical protein